MNVTNEWGANYYVLVGTKQLNSINAFTTAPYSNGGNVVFWIALNSQKQWRALPSGNYFSTAITITYPIAFTSAVWAIIATPSGDNSEGSIYSQFSLGSKNNNSCVLRNNRSGTTPGGYIIVCGQQEQWGTLSSRGTITLPISYTSFYIPIVSYGTRINWDPMNSSPTAYKVSLSQLNVYAQEGNYFWYATFGKQYNGGMQVLQTLILLSQ